MEKINEKSRFKAVLQINLKSLTYFLIWKDYLSFILIVNVHFMNWNIKKPEANLF